MFARYRAARSAAPPEAPTHGGTPKRRKVRPMLLPAAAAALSLALVGMSVPIAAAVVSGTHTAPAAPRAKAKAQKRRKKTKVTKRKVTKRKPGFVHAMIAVTSAPTLTASGTTLTWTAIPGVSEYELATIRTVGTSKITTYSTVTGKSDTPTAYPGETVYYGLRAYVTGSTWSAQVPITWPNTKAPTVTLSGTSALVDADDRREHLRGRDSHRNYDDVSDGDRHELHPPGGPGPDGQLRRAQLCPRLSVVVPGLDHVAKHARSGTHVVRHDIVVDADHRRERLRSRPSPELPRRIGR